MRTRSRRRTRSSIPLDFHRILVDGLGGCIFRPIRTSAPRELDFVVRFCEDILGRAPEHAEALALLGETYTRRGDYAKGLATDLLLKKLRPDSSVVSYNLACSLALNGQTEEALASLAKAIELGYRDLDHARKDRDLEVLRDDPRFWALLQRLVAYQQKAGRS